MFRGWKSVYLINGRKDGGMKHGLILFNFIQPQAYPKSVLHVLFSDGLVTNKRSYCMYLRHTHSYLIYVRNLVFKTEEKANIGSV